MRYSAMINPVYDPNLPGAPGTLERVAHLQLRYMSTLVDTLAALPSSDETFCSYSRAHELWEYFHNHAAGLGGKVADHPDVARTIKYAADDADIEDGVYCVSPALLVWAEDYLHQSTQAFHYDSQF